MPVVILPRGNSKYEPTIARPHPPVDHSGALAAFAFVLAIDGAWFVEVPFPYGAAVAMLMTVAGAWSVRRMRKTLRKNPQTDLAMFIEPWALLTLAALLVVAAYDLDRGASLTDWVKSLSAALFGGGFFALVPAALAGMLQASRAAEGGEVPPGSCARKAVALGPWRSIASTLWIANFLALMPTMGRAKAPLRSLGSMVALACVLIVAYVLLAQQYWLRSSRRQVELPFGGGTYRNPPARPVEDPASPELLERIAKRELKRGVWALLFALIPLALHALVLFG